MFDMKNILLAALLLMVGCQSADPEGETTAAPPATTPDDVAPATGADLFVGKVWMSEDSSAVPGTMRVFLPDGTLLLGSCWETYRLAEWRAETERTLVWQEDSEDIRADIEELTGGALRLRMALKEDTEVQIFRSAEVPYLCPEMPIE